MPKLTAKIYIDLTDVVYHAIWHPSCGGIPRVQFEVAHALLRDNPNVVPFSLRDGAWRDLSILLKEAAGDSDRFFAELHKEFVYLRERPRWHEPRHVAMLVKGRLGALYAKIRSRSPQLQASDTLFVGGAFWSSPHVIAFARRAASRGVNLIVLFYDLIPILHPHYTGHDFAAEYEIMLRLPAHFIVTSGFNRNELEAARTKFCGPAQETSVFVVPLADEFPGAQRNEHVALVPPRFAHFADRCFVLCVGTIEIRKNHMMLLSVWEALAEELGDTLPILVVAGRRGWKAEAAIDKLDRLPPESRIVFVEAPDDEELRWLYSACRFTVLPSFFEGWGLPVGESFWFGKACAASNTSSVPVVGRDLCRYFSPREPEEMKAALRDLLDPERRKCFEEKIARANLRSWSEVAADMERVITACAAAPATRSVPGEAELSSPSDAPNIATR